MLKIININPIVNNTVEIDYHVPFTVNVDEKNVFNEKKIYWRTGNFNNSLLEIGIGEKSGELKSIVLTMVNKASTENIEFEVLEISKGVPIFDISMLHKNIYDHVSEYSVSLTTSSVLVVFSEKRVVKTLIRMERVEMGFGFENELIFIKVNELSLIEYQDFKDSFRL